MGMLFVGESVFRFACLVHVTGYMNLPYDLHMNGLLCCRRVERQWGTSNCHHEWSGVTGVCETWDKRWEGRTAWTAVPANDEAHCVWEPAETIHDLHCPRICRCLIGLVCMWQWHSMKFKCDALQIQCKRSPCKLFQVSGIHHLELPTLFFAAMTYYLVFQHDFGPNRHVFTWVSGNKLCWSIAKTDCQHQL